MNFYRSEDRVVVALALASVLVVAGLIAQEEDGYGRAVVAALGVNYGQVADNLPEPDEVVRIVASIPASQVKLFNANASVVSAFAGTGVSLLVAARNDELSALGDENYASQWVESNVRAFYPDTRIVGVVVGNEVSSRSTMALVLPAMTNVRSALAAAGLGTDVFVSTAHSFATLSVSYPPSAGAFDPSLADAYMRPVLAFLADNDAPFMINAYPYFAYVGNPGAISLAYCLLEDGAPTSYDSATGLTYTNMFDAQLDAVYSAITRLGFDGINVVVSEIGWPSAGGGDEPAATLSNAAAFHSNLVRRLASGSSSPLHPDRHPDVYYFALFNEDLKSGSPSEQHYGLFYPDGSKVFDF
jgi:hypothetical protein